MRKYGIILVVIFLIALTSCGSDYAVNGADIVSDEIETTVDDGESYVSTSGTLNHDEVMPTQDLQELNYDEIYPDYSERIVLEPDDDIVENSYSNEIITIQDLFEPKDSVIYFEGMPYSIKLYPFGEIVKSEEYGRASFVIFVEADHAVEQCNNFLRITPLRFILDEIEISVEIMQLTDITVTDAEHQIKSEIDFNSYQNSFITYPTEAFPFHSIHLFEGFELNSKITSIHIKDNNYGGVFVITERLNLGNIGCVGVRFTNYIRTLEVIDTSNS